MHSKLYAVILKKVFPKAFTIAKKAYPEECGTIGDNFIPIINSRYKALEFRLRQKPLTLNVIDMKLDNTFFIDIQTKDMQLMYWCAIEDKQDGVILC